MTSTSKTEINFYLPIIRQDIKVYSLFILLMIIAIVGFINFKFIEFDIASKLTIKWFLIPSIAIAIFYAYYSAIKRSSHKSIFRQVMLFISLTIIFSVILLKSFESALLIYNGYIGQQKEVQIVGLVSDVTLPKREGILSTYKTVISLDNHKILTLDIIGQKFQIGEKFTEKMNIGSLGLLYKK